MKNFILKRIQGLYYYYSTGTKADIPYFKTISVLVLFIFLHYLEFIFLLKRFAAVSIDLFPFSESARGLTQIIILLCFLPVHLLLTWLFPKREVSKISDTEDRLVSFRNQFFMYAGFLLIAIIVTLWPHIKFR